jgi:uncharacterized membrane protein
MTGLVLGLALAVAGSFALNASYLLQHAGSRTAPAIHPLRLRRSLAGLLRSPLWTAGLALGLGGWGLHVAALALAPLSLVQAFSAGGLALAAPVGARVLHERLTRREWLGVATIVASLVLLAWGLSAPAHPPRTPVRAMTAYLAAAAAAAALLAALPRGHRRALGLGAAGGILYGAGDAATKALTGAFDQGALAVVTSPWLGVLAVSAAAAFLCFQRGLQTGPGVAVIALMTGATSAVAIGAGIVVFGDPLGATPVLSAAHGLALTLVVVAGWLLAPAQDRLGGPAAAAVQA